MRSLDCSNNTSVLQYIMPVSVKRKGILLGSGRRGSFVRLLAPLNRVAGAPMQGQREPPTLSNCCPVLASAAECYL